MKWGIRKDRRKNATLTDAGKKRIAEKAGLYMNPEHRDKKSTNRKAVAREYVNAYDKLMRKHGIDPELMDGTEAARKLEQKTGKKQLDDKLWNSFMDKYADATLKDLGYENVANGREYVKELFKEALVNIDDE